MHVDQQHAEEHGHNLADVRRQEVAQELADVGEDRPPFLDGRDDGCEVVVGEHHVGRLLGHVGPGDAHGHADVGGLERRRVVDPVAVMATSRPPRCSALTIRSLCSGLTRA